MDKCSTLSGISALALAACGAAYAQEKQSTDRISLDRANFSSAIGRINLGSIGPIICPLCLLPTPTPPPPIPALPNPIQVLNDIQHAAETGVHLAETAMWDVVRNTEATSAGLVESGIAVVKSGANSANVIWNDSAGAIVNVTETIDENVDKRVTATFGKDVSNYVMAWHYKADDIRQKISDGVDAAKAGARYAEREAAAEVKNAERTANYLKQGDVGKAIIASSIDRARSNEDNSFKAMQESALIRQAAQQAAATYGGPGGAAAFEAWYTYRTTGDVDQAWKAGISTGIASQVGAQAAAMPSGPAQEILSKAVVAGTAGGIAVAMQGGSEADVTNAFLRTGGNVIIQSASDAVATRVGAENMETARCISARDLGCLSHSKFVTEAHDKLQRYVVDLNGQLPPLQAIDEYTGTWLGSNPATPKGRQALFVGSISKLPLLDAVPVDGKRFLLSTSFGTAGPLSGTKPFVVLTEYPECATSLRSHVPDGAVGACPFSWNVKHVRTEAEGAQLRPSDESSGKHEAPG